jgi:excisionase family DNA binding protein
MLSINELAEKINVSSITVRRWIKSGDITAVTLGRAYRISENEVDRIISCGVSLKNRSLTIPKKTPMRRNSKGIRPWEK